MRRLAIVLISVIVTFWSSAPIVQAQFLEAGIVKFRVPVEAPDFRLTKLTGGEISLKELKGKVVILNFFDTAWPDCQKESPSLSKLYEESRNADIAIYRVAIKEKEQVLIKFRDKFKVACPILIDEKGQVANAFRVRGHPETYFINRKGKIVGRALGGKDWTSSNMRNLIQYLLREGY